MFNSAFRLLLLASAVFFADLTLAQDGCRYPNQGDRRYHYGRQLVFLTEVLIDEIYESRECSRGYNRIGAYAENLIRTAIDCRNTGAEKRTSTYVNAAGDFHSWRQGGKVCKPDIMTHVTTDIEVAVGSQCDVRR